MKQLCVSRLSFFTAGLLAATVAVLHVACEETPSDEGVDEYFSNNPYQSAPRGTPTAAAITITPLNATGRPGELTGFSAVGGLPPFGWAVGTLANGTIAAQADTRYAIYTHLGTTNSINSVVVTDSSGAAAVAAIN